MNATILIFTSVFNFYNIQPGDIVAVWRCGDAGLMAQRSTYLLVAKRVIAIDRLPQQLRITHE